jgi:hypothetical protein
MCSTSRVPAAAPYTPDTSAPCWTVLVHDGVPIVHGFTRVVPTFHRADTDAQRLLRAQGLADALNKVYGYV